MDKVDELVRLMTQLAIPLAGAASRTIYRALCQDAVRHGGVKLMVAERGGRVVGFCIAVLCWSEYWKRFLLRWPLCAAPVVVARMQRWWRGLRKAGDPQPGGRAAAVENLLESSPAMVDWDHARNDVMNIAYMAVVPEFRGTHTGYRLLSASLEYFEAEGAATVLARARRDNAASLRLAQALGFRIYGAGDDVIAVYTRGNRHQRGLRKHAR